MEIREDASLTEPIATAPTDKAVQPNRKMKRKTVVLGVVAVCLVFVVTAVMCFGVIPYHGPIATVSRAVDQTLETGAFDLIAILSTDNYTELSLNGSVLFDLENRDLTADIYVSVRNALEGDTTYRLLIYQGNGAYVQSSGEVQYGDMSTTVADIFDRLDTLTGYATFRQDTLETIVDQYYSSQPDAVDYPDLQKRLNRLVRKMNQPNWLSEHFSSYRKTMKDGIITYGLQFTLQQCVAALGDVIRPAFSDGDYFDYVKSAYLAGLESVDPIVCSVSLQDGFLSNFSYKGIYKGANVDFYLSLREIGTSSITEEDVAFAFASLQES